MCMMFDLLSKAKMLVLSKEFSALKNLKVVCFPISTLQVADIPGSSGWMPSAQGGLREEVWGVEGWGRVVWWQWRMVKLVC
jgi:hypothetical protein